MSDLPTLNCADERRRRMVRAKPLNGIDYVEVSEDQVSLCVHLFGDIPEGLSATNVRIEGGRRIRDIRVRYIEPGPECLRVIVNKPGDFSAYTLKIVALKDGKVTEEPFPGFDPRYSHVAFSFKINCPSDLDCQAEVTCPPEPLPEPEISYLAKDYASFRQLILDRLAIIMPSWQERHIPDIGITLVELLAYVGDYLSYHQDAVATEAYLDTARLRISVRRHARLVDYVMHEGCNARTFVCLQPDQNCSLPVGESFFITGDGFASGAPGSILKEHDLQAIPADLYETFHIASTSVENVLLYKAHNILYFYTWGDEECCLPRGATSATLKEGRPAGAEARQAPATKGKKSAPMETQANQVLERLHLKPGDILLFEEILGPRTGNEADADPSHRHAVRLTGVEHDIDPLTGQGVVEITWAEEDALPFPLCLSAIGEAPECLLLRDVSVAYGNVVLVEHGRRIEQTLGPVEPADDSATICEGEEQPVDVVPLPKRFEAQLGLGPLTFHAPIPQHGTSAAALLIQKPNEALPWIRLTEAPADAGEPQRELTTQPAWNAKGDLLHSSPAERTFVVEMDNDGIAHLRFGDGTLGRSPEPGMRFQAVYYVGNGTTGNVGADQITRLVMRSPLQGIPIQVRNPLAAQGGLDPQPLSEVKMLAPSAFRKQLARAITADDYARLAEDVPGVHHAAGELVWTGSWYEARVGVLPLGREEVSPALRRAVLASLYPYRRMGYDLAVTQARRIPLDIEIDICVKPHYLRGHVEAALRDLFSNRVLPNGRKGLFHPDNLDFGLSIKSSRLVAAAQAVEGVQNVVIRKLERLYEGPNGEIEKGELSLGPLEVAQVDTDPNFPEHGRVILNMGGGQ